MMNSYQFYKELRKIIPDLPEDCQRLDITILPDHVPLIRVELIPKMNKLQGEIKRLSVMRIEDDEKNN